MRARPTAFLLLATLCLVMATVSDSGVLTGVLIALGLVLGLIAVIASWRPMPSRPVEGVHHSDNSRLPERNRG